MHGVYMVKRLACPVFTAHQTWRTTTMLSSTAPLMSVVPTSKTQKKSQSNNVGHAQNISQHQQIKRSLKQMHNTGWIGIYVDRNQMYAQILRSIYKHIIKYENVRVHVTGLKRRQYIQITNFTTFDENRVICKIVLIQQHRRNTKKFYFHTSHFILHLHYSNNSAIVDMTATQTSVDGIIFNSTAVF